MLSPSSVEQTTFRVESDATRRARSGRQGEGGLKEADECGAEKSNLRLLLLLRATGSRHHSSILLQTGPGQTSFARMSVAPSSSVPRFFQRTPHQPSRRHLDAIHDFQNKPRADVSHCFRVRVAESVRVD